MCNYNYKGCNISIIRIAGKKKKGINAWKNNNWWFPKINDKHQARDPGSS